MRLKRTEDVSCDILIIGGGGASLRAAIEAKEMGADVLVVSKSRVGYNNNTYISAGVFAATGWGDSQDDHRVHLEDTVVGGRFLNDQKLVNLTAQQAGTQVTFLERCGVNFSRHEGNLRLAHTPGHTYPRHISVVPRKGSGFMLPLREYAEGVGVRFLDHIFITKLFARDNSIAAATGIGDKGSFLAFRTKCIILATGGFAHIYERTNNASGITGDGQVLAYELGLPLKDMEFVQFYPTSLGRFGNRGLLYEAIVARGGAQLKNAQGENILSKHGMTAPIQMTRDRVTRAVMKEILAGLDVEGGVILDLSTVSNLSRLQSFFPAWWKEDQKEFIVAPTTHFCMGGVVINAEMETPVTGLFAAGEVCAGVHGANRLGGNALTEVFALGGVAGRNGAQKAKKLDFLEMPEEDIEEEKRRLDSFLSQGGQSQKTLRDSLKEVMWYKAGIIRSKRILEEALDRIRALQPLSLKVSITKVSEFMKFLELQNMLMLSEMVCRSALLRTESRGAHYRSDYPEEDNDNWLRNIVVCKKAEEMSLEAIPVSLDMVAMKE